jgi:hypothetical protein
LVTTWKVLFLVPFFPLRIHEVLFLSQQFELKVGFYLESALFSAFVPLKFHELLFFFGARMSKVPFFPLKVPCWSLSQHTLLDHTLRTLGLAGTLNDVTC